MKAILMEWELYRRGGASGTAGVSGADGATAAGGLTRPEARWSTVYFGGGTPTYLDEDILEGIIAGLLRGAEGTPSAPGRGKGDDTPYAAAAAEFTVEANPGTLTESKLRLLRRAGCSRLSLGAQSFDDQALAWLGRRHSAEDFRQAWVMARSAGFANMNLDLMYGLPDQAPGHWRETLEEALTFRPEHISLYQLSIEEGTPLAGLAAAGQKSAADEETCRQQYLLAHDALTEAGYRHYEISNYAKPGFESRHNTHYWRMGLYLGLGAGAAGHLRGFRYTNKADLEGYLRDLEGGALPISEKESVHGQTALAEEMMLAFRLREGVEKAPFLARHGVTMERKYGETLAKRIRAGLLEDDGERVSPSLEGWLSYNSWITDFF